MVSLQHPLNELVSNCQKTLQGVYESSVHLLSVLDRAILVYNQKAATSCRTTDESEYYAEVIAFLELKQLAQALEEIATPVAAATERRRVNFPRATVEILQNWLYQHANYPFPTDVEKLELSRRANITVKQVSDWFMNARRRRQLS